MKIAFISENMNFCKPILKELQKEHEVSIFKFAQEVNLERYARLIHWADLVYCEWADHLLQVASWLSPPEKKIVARIHRYELYSKLLPEIRWKNVDLLVSNIASNHVIEKFKKIVEDLPKKIIVLPDGVDLKFWKFYKREFKKPYQLCVVGNIIPRKGIYELIRMFSALPKNDFVLNIVGKRWPEYYENCRELCNELELGDRVKFWDHMEQEKLVRFFKNMHIIVSNSRDEGNHTVIKEGMATGLFPVVNCWKGARETYPEKCIFTNQEDFVNIVMDFYEDANEEVESHSARQWIKAKYDAEVQAVKLRGEIESVFSVEDKVREEVKREMSEVVSKEIKRKGIRSIKAEIDERKKTEKLINNDDLVNLEIAKEAEDARARFDEWC